MLKLLKRLGTREIVMAIVSTVLVAFQVWLDLKLPDYMSEITIIIKTPGSAIGDVWLAGGKMMLCALGSLAASIFVGYLAAHIAAGFSRDLRHDVFDKVQSFSFGEINKFSTPSLITRSTNDVTQIQTLIALGLQIMIKAPIMAVWAVIKIAGKGQEWTVATVIFVVFLIIVISIVFILVTPRFRRMQWLTDAVNRITRENLTGLRVVRAYNAEQYQQHRFAEANRDLADTQMFTSRVTAVIGPCITIILNGLTLSIYWIGASLISSAGIPEKLTLLSNMVVFTSYAMQVIMAFMMLTMIFIMLPRVLISVKRINEVLDTKLTVVDGKGVVCPEDIVDEDTVCPEEADESVVCPEEIVGEVEFKNVCFKYPGAEDYVIKNVSFTAHKGETVAFIGSTGSGKSTVINLVPRFYDVTDGEILVDGVDVREYTLKQLRNKLGYIPQRSVLFSGTVSSNVAYGDNGKAPPSEEEIKRAVAVAQGSDFVEAMPEGYESLIAQGGTNISGGQKQRLCIARAVCRDPEIFIFDDSFSALDFKTDKSLRQALRAELGNATNLIVAQRIGTIRDADRIVVLEQGEVAGIGTHSELMKSCEVYREIALSQLSEEELENE
ncbi:MAG: ABC transporter ATP-binding protein [Clostridia bacterium]|nr:ABC transporter ATP-binding protein [Clostridia bacterium]